jgi:hypothetical protein
VSTIWCGVAPVVFESMVSGGPLDEQQVWTATEAEAYAAHRAMAVRA